MINNAGSCAETFPYKYFQEPWGCSTYYLDVLGKKLLAIIRKTEHVTAYFPAKPRPLNLTIMLSFVSDFISRFATQGLKLRLADHQFE